MSFFVCIVDQKLGVCISICFYVLVKCQPMYLATFSHICFYRCMLYACTITTIPAYFTYSNIAKKVLTIHNLILISEVHYPIYLPAAVFIINILLVLDTSVNEPCLHQSISQYVFFRKWFKAPSTLHPSYPATSPPCPPSSKQKMKLDYIPRYLS